MRLPARGGADPGRHVRRGRHGRLSQVARSTPASRHRSTAAAPSTSWTCDALAAANADLILTQELCTVCAVSYREVTEAVRQLDSETTRRQPRADVDRGHPQHDLDRRRHGRGRGRGGRPHRASARTPGRASRTASSSDASTACRRVASSASSGWIRRSRRATGCRSRFVALAAGICSDAMGEPAVETTLGARARRRSGAADAHPLRLRRVPNRRRVAIAAAPAGLRSSRISRAVRNGEVYALDGSAYFSRPGPRVVDGVALLADLFDPDFVGRDAARERMAADRSRVTVAPPAAGVRRRVQGLASTACGVAGHTRREPTRTSRAGRCLCPECVGNAQDNEFLRFRLREGLRSADQRQPSQPEAAARRRRR